MKTQIKKIKNASRPDGLSTLQWISYTSKPTMSKLERHSKLLVMLRHFPNQLIHEMTFLVKSPTWVALHHISYQT